MESVDVKVTISADDVGAAQATAEIFAALGDVEATDADGFYGLILAIYITALVKLEMDEETLLRGFTEALSWAADMLAKWNAANAN